MNYSPNEPFCRKYNKRKSVKEKHSNLSILLLKMYHHLISNNKTPWLRKIKPKTLPPLREFYPFFLEIQQRRSFII